jgi:hypothetical protein
MNKVKALVLLLVLTAFALLGAKPNVTAQSAKTCHTYCYLGGDGGPWVCKTICQ